MSKYFIPYEEKDDMAYPEDVKKIREIVESQYGRFSCTNQKIGELWRHFSYEYYDAGFLIPDDRFIKQFVDWLCSDEGD